MNNKLLYFLIVIFLIIAFYFLIYKNSIIETFIPDSESMYNNVYNPKGIKIDTEGKNLIYNNKSVYYGNKFNNNIKSKNLSNDKINTNILLKNNGFPVCNFMEWNNNINDESNIININEQLKFPLVVKFNYGCKGKDVFTDIINNEQLVEKINYLKNNNKNSILIEEQVTGDKYRIMILNDKFIYANKQIKPIMKGDGISNIKTLIQKYPKQINIINEDLIRQQGYNLDDILEKNKELTITNVLSGMNGIDEINVLERDIHPVNMKMFANLNNLIGLNFSGIDYIGPDLSKPYFDGGKIIEINADPTFNTSEQKKSSVINNFINALFT